MKIWVLRRKIGGPLEKSNRGRSTFFAHQLPEILTDFDMVFLSDKLGF